MVQDKLLKLYMFAHLFAFWRGNHGSPTPLPILGRSLAPRVLPRSPVACSISDSALLTSISDYGPSRVDCSANPAADAHTEAMPSTRRPRSTRSPLAVLFRLSRCESLGVRIIVQPNSHSLSQIVDADATCIQSPPVQPSPARFSPAQLSPA